MRLSFLSIFLLPLSFHGSAQLSQSVQGDFNGDGKLETAKFIVINERNQTGGYDPMYFPVSYAIQFSEKNIPTISLGDFMGGILVKKDFNKNSKDELMVVGTDGEGLHYGSSYILYELQKENMQSVFIGSMPPLLEMRNCQDSLIITFNDTVYLLSHPPLLNNDAWFILKAQKIHPILDPVSDTVTRMHVLYPFVKKFVADSVLFNNRIYLATDLDTLPQFPGGKEEMQKFIITNLIYPQYAKEMNIEGTVHFTFVVNKDGSLHDFQWTNKVDEILAKEIIRVYKKMPDWQPGIKNGKPVRIKMNASWEFDLER